jgi:uncharacterized protein (TIGR03118 family)
MQACLGAFRRVSTVLPVMLAAACGGGGYGGDGGSNPPASISLSIEPTSITLGESATLTWNTNGANCTAGGAWSGTKSASGSETVTPSETGTLTYSLFCGGGGYGESQTRMATLTVEPATGFTRTMLVAGFAGGDAMRTDAAVVDPRGIAFAPGAPARLASGGRAPGFDGTGKRTSPSWRSGVSLSSTAAFDPTGIVASGSAFLITVGGQSDAAAFILAGKDGTIRAVPRGDDAAETVILHASRDGAVYTGLALARDAAGTFLYAADFRNKRIEVFDATLERRPARRFEDPTLPDGYAPFGIQAVVLAGGATRIYVSYAQQLSSGSGDSVNGPGVGVVNAFDTQGRFLARLATGGALDAPWGMALAPAGFGALGKALLVANSGDGRINAFDPQSGRFRGTVADVDGRPLATPGLRGIAFGNGSHGQPRSALFFTAGTDAADGVFGRIDPGATPPLLDASD